MQQDSGALNNVKWNEKQSWDNFYQRIFLFFNNKNTTFYNDGEDASKTIWNVSKIIKAWGILKMGKCKILSEKMDRHGHERDLSQ